MQIRIEQSLASAQQKLQVGSVDAAAFAATPAAASTFSKQQP